MKRTLRITSLPLPNRVRHLLCGVLALFLVFGVAPLVHADLIPYPTPGDVNPVTYTFTAASTGDVIAYFAGSQASYDNQLGMLINGVLSSAGYGLDNQTSSLGDAFNLGHVTAGNTLVFMLHNISGLQTPPDQIDAFSDPSLNAGYDDPSYTGSHNHVYSTAYTQSPPIASIPKGTYVGFEDLRFPNSDFNYFDETFVFTNVNTIVGVPEPSSASVVLVVSLVGGAIAFKCRGGRKA